MLGEFTYQSGLGNTWSSEALPGALPSSQNSPQKVNYGLYAEQLSGSAFSALRSENYRSWLYRIRPSFPKASFHEIDARLLRTAPLLEAVTSPDPLRWDPVPLPSGPTDFIEGLITIAANGSSEDRRGCAVHLYGANRSMETRFFYNADGEFLIVPQEGALHLKTEFGNLEVHPKEIAVLPRGVRFQVFLPEQTSRGYVCENYGAPFRLPNLGVLGVNALANPRHFLAPNAAYQDLPGSFELVSKFLGRLFTAPLERSPLDVVAWYGNYAPYKYDLNLFNTLGSISFDHPDPSIFTVLTSPSETPGVANVDFVLFPPRWLVGEHTFRPPYFHRNVMSEYMGLIHGKYDAKAKGFLPGGGSLHNVLAGHGPDAETYEKAISAELKPQYVGETLAFMFESASILRVSQWALQSNYLQKDYLGCWRGLKPSFNPKGGNHG